VLKEYKSIIDKYGVSKTIAVATEALRKAENAEEFIKEVKEKTGIDIKVISPEEEGKLAYKAVCFSLKIEGRNVVVDQGGGSTEFIYGKSCNIEKVVSIPMGIVNLTEKWEELKEMERFIDNNLECLNKKVDGASKVHGSVLKKDTIKKWLDKISRMSIEERKSIPQIEDRRAEAIVSGILMFERILEYFEKDEIIVSDWGVKQGLLVSLI